jgi:hypothetical protein
MKHSNKTGTIKEKLNKKAEQHPKKEETVIPRFQENERSAVNRVNEQKEINESNKFSNAMNRKEEVNAPDNKSSSSGRYLSKAFFTFLLSILLTAATPAFIYATAKAIPAKEASTQANQLLGRLNEINNIDKSHLNSNEKRELRKEVKGIKQQLHDLNGGVYLSIGAIIIILLLLILLL